MPRETFLRTIGTAASAIGHDLTRAAWSEPAALAEYTVGGLAGHLARAAITVDRYLDEPPPEQTHNLTDAVSYFVEAMGSEDPIDSDMHRQVRHRGEEAGSIGPDALIVEIDATKRRLSLRLQREASNRRVSVFGGRAMDLNCYLETRIVELVVHTDDLTASVGLDMPEVDGRALAITRRVLSNVAAQRHGEMAVIRSHARSERSNGSATAF